jgi:hypothetical protein
VIAGIGGKWVRIEVKLGEIGGNWWEMVGSGGKLVGNWWEIGWMWWNVVKSVKMCGAEQVDKHIKDPGPRACRHVFSRSSRMWLSISTEQL